MSIHSAGVGDVDCYDAEDRFQTSSSWRDLSVFSGLSAIDLALARLGLFRLVRFGDSLEIHSDFTRRHSSAEC
jgi:hypothetical protein